MLTNIYENLSIIVSLSAILYSLFPVSATFCFFCFFPWCNHLIVANKENNYPCLPPPPPSFLLSLLRQHFSTRRFEMNVVLRIVEALRLWEPQPAFRPSACLPAEMTDGHELPADVGREGPGASSSPSDWSTQRRTLQEAVAPKAGGGNNVRHTAAKLHHKWSL